MLHFRVYYISKRETKRDFYVPFFCAGAWDGSILRFARQAGPIPARLKKEKRNMVKAVVGANWGDEGKGKITDMLAKEADIIIRFQGGANAGHTIVNEYGKFALHTLPSGVFYNHTTSIIGNGVALNIPVLFNEIKSITDRNVPMPDRKSVV